MATFELDDDQIAEQLRHAFKPHRCVVEYEDYHAKLGLCVYPKDGSGLRQIFEGKLTASLRDPAALVHFIQETRKHLEARGVKF
jgi:hypothetical protein